RRCRVQSLRAGPPQHDFPPGLYRPRRTLGCDGASEKTLQNRNYGMASPGIRIHEKASLSATKIGRNAAISDDATDCGLRYEHWSRASVIWITNSRGIGKYFACDQFS